jgi:hypothetical protein
MCSSVCGVRVRWVLEADLTKAEYEKFCVEEARWEPPGGVEGHAHFQVKKGLT